VGPVLEDSPGSQELEDGLLRVAADAGGEREPMRAVDGRDRVELDRAQAADGRLDLAGLRAPIPRGEALRGDDQPPDLLEADGQRAWAR
jgi:hypothetical protein